jgi:hypothetical protein
MVLIVWQTDTHSTFNYVLTIHFTLRARARDARSDWSRLCTDCSFSALKYRQYFTLWPLSHSSSGLQLITLHGLVHSYERVKVRARE